MREQGVPVDKEVHDKFWNTLHHNGWIWERDESVEACEFDTYAITILVEYEAHCFARISTNKSGMSFNGQLGVLWIDVLFENDPPYSPRDLWEMKKAIEYAEINLLTIGVPFTKDYKFLGKEADKKREKNIQLREKWGLDELEIKISERLKKDKTSIS